MRLLLLIAPFVSAMSLSGCFLETCYWYGCEDLGGGFCIWYDGSRGDFLVYIDAEAYADGGCNQNSAIPISDTVQGFEHSDRFVVYSECRLHHSEQPPGWGDRNAPRPTVIYYWIIDKERNAEWRHGGDRLASAPSESAIFGPLDSLRLIQEADARGVDSALVSSLTRKRLE